MQIITCKWVLIIIIIKKHEVAYWKTRNQTEKVIIKTIKTEAEKELEELREKQNKIFKFIKLMKGRENETQNGLSVEVEQLVSVKQIDVIMKLTFEENNK